MTWFTMALVAFATQLELVVLGERPAIIASAADEDIDWWIGSLAFLGSLVAIGVIAAVVVRNARRNQRP